MKQLWAPWRSSYINIKPQHRKRCFLCSALKDNNDEKNLVVARGKRCFVMLNLFPYNAGHLLVAPVKHKADLEDLSQEEIQELFGLTIKMKKVLTRILKPEGFNIGFNIGSVAGAGLLSHIHLHLVPRWGGDTNFMPVLSGTKVISQSLLDLYRKLRREL
ncbi:MAG: HIT domain-containing protein [Planctomycetota bacterium]|nr:HIT domain-containing protein [Planctomycetota bacterium]MDI6786962.1 HIT domain-containing protein [Planctomycetota bacterium]